MVACNYWLSNCFLFSVGHSLTQFVRHCADHYLASEYKEIRMEAVKTCARLLTPLLNVSLILNVFGVSVAPWIRCLVLRWVDVHVSVFSKHIFHSGYLCPANSQWFFSYIAIIVLKKTLKQIRSLSSPYIHWTSNISIEEYRVCRMNLQLSYS